MPIFDVYTIVKLIPSEKTSLLIFLSFQVLEKVCKTNNYPGVCSFIFNWQKTNKKTLINHQLSLDTRLNLGFGGCAKAMQTLPICEADAILTSRLKKKRNLIAKIKI